MLLISWGTLATQVSIAINQVPMTTQDHLDRLAQAACEIAVVSNDTMEFIGHGPIWTLHGDCRYPLRVISQLNTLTSSEPDCLIVRIFEKGVRNA